MYGLKVNPNDSLTSLKASLVAKCSGVWGWLFAHFLSVVAKLTSFRILISLAATYNCPFVKNAFLHGTLHEYVYMEQLPGFVAQGDSVGLVCKLKNSLYGLMQSHWLGLEDFQFFIFLLLNLFFPSLFFWGSLVNFTNLKWRGTGVYLLIPPDNCFIFSFPASRRHLLCSCQKHHGSYPRHFRERFFRSLLDIFHFETDLNCLSFLWYFFWDDTRVKQMIIL